MKLSCLQENLVKGLGIVGRAVATRTTLPITSNVLLAAEESRLKLVATNLEMAVTCWIGAKVEEEGSITVPARLLTEFVGALPSELIDLTLSGHVLELRCARFDARISGIDAADFPPIPQVRDGLTTRIESEVLRSAINHVVFATASEETRPVLTGAHIEVEQGTLTLAAADGFRLAVYKVPLLEPVSEKVEFVMPGRALNEILRLSTDQEEPIEIEANKGKSHVVVRLKSIEVVSQLLQGTFPNYKQLIPQSYATRAVVSATEFLRATRTASIFARDGSGIVKLEVQPGGELGPGRVKISARSEQMGDNKGEIDASVEGGATKIAFNAKYLVDVLNVLREGQVALETTTSSSPGVIRPVGSDSYVHVVMPMFVQW